jgi:DNA-binding NarL/FixJ family response regulator
MTIRVVLVDDLPALRELYRIALESAGAFAIVGEADDGHSGVEVVARTRPDLVLLDLSMPSMDGLEALQKMLAASPASRVVILSAFKRERMGPIAERLGATAYIEKGVPPTQLAPLLSQAMQAPLPGLATVSRAELQAMQERIKQLV